MFSYPKQDKLDTVFAAFFCDRYSREHEKCQSFDSPDFVALLPMFLMVKYQ